MSINENWYQKDVGEIETLLQTSKNGIKNSDIPKLTEKYG